MKRLIVLLALSFVFQITTMAQNSKSPKNTPKEDIKVNREYDEKGNLIRFDSIYSYSFSGDTTLQDLNFGDFPANFGSNFSFFSDSSFNDSFMKDFNFPFFESLSQNEDSIFNKFHQFHNFKFKNDSTGQYFWDMEDFFKQFQDFKTDSSSTQHFQSEFNFSPQAMFEMMQKQMQEMEERHRQYFSK
ncbi:MAG TPA: hypothetical protein VFG54_14335 [Prolixibacteraceae bacterium]|nr:hypothetical protein [Prolixibacteraceae bacterium]